MKNIFTYTFFLLNVGSIFFSCDTASVSPRGYVDWIRNEGNGLNVKKRIGQFEFTLQYKPVDYVILDQFKNDSINKTLVDSLSKNYDDMQYYTLRIKADDANELMRSGISDESEYDSRLEYFLSEAQDDMMLVENGDTLPCELYHFERNYNLAPMNDIVLGFAKTKFSDTSDKTFIYEDQVLDTGPVELTIQASDIKRIPSICYVQN
jgi:hypothetical protein